MVLLREETSLVPCKKRFFNESLEEEESILIWAYELGKHAWHEPFVREIIVNFQKQPVQALLKALLTRYLKNQQ